VPFFSSFALSSLHGNCIEKFKLSENVQNAVNGSSVRRPHSADIAISLALTSQLFGQANTATNEWSNKSSAQRNGQLKMSSHSKASS